MCLLVSYDFFYILPIPIFSSFLIGVFTLSLLIYKSLYVSSEY